MKSGCEYLIDVDSVVNEAYRSRIEEIKILRKNGSLQEFTEVSDNTILFKQITKCESIIYALRNNFTFAQS
jgi:hypothetical protein